MRRNPLSRPLIGLALTYMAGTWLGFSIDVSSRILLALSLAALLVWGWIACLRRFHRDHPAMSARLGTMGILALHISVVTVAWCRTAVYRVEHRGDLDFSNAGGQVRVMGTVRDDPFVRRVSRGTAQMGNFPLRVTQIEKKGGGWLEANGEMEVRWYEWEGRGMPAYGQRWEFRGAPQRIPRSKAARDKSEGRPWTQYQTHFLNVTRSRARLLEDAHGWDRLVQRCYGAREATAEYLAIGIEDHPETVGLLQAILLGRRQLLSREAWQWFVATGTLHVFAVSGGHVVVLAMLMVLIFKACRLSREYWILWLGPFLIAYTLAIGACASAVRACIMAIIYYLGPILGRKSDITATLAASALLIVAVSPTQMFDLGFILSYAAVIGLILLYSQFERPLRRLWEPDPWRIQPEEKSVSMLRAVAGHLCSLMAMSCAAWLVTTPLMAYFFGQFSPIAIVSNLVVVPLASLVMLTGCLSIVLGACAGVLADIFNHANLALVWVMLKATSLLSRVPYGYFKGECVSGWLVAGWYGALGLAVLWNRAKSAETETGQAESREEETSAEVD